VQFLGPLRLHSLTITNIVWSLKREAELSSETLVTYQATYRAQDPRQQQSSQSVRWGPQNLHNIRLKVNRRFGGTCHLQTQGRRIKPWKKPAWSSACYLLRADFLLGLFFNPENGGDMLLRNVRLFSWNYTALYSIRLRTVTLCV
jgi:hypothetical protein